MFERSSHGQFDCLKWSRSGDSVSLDQPQEKRKQSLIMAGSSSKSNAVVLVGAVAIFLVSMEIMVMQAESAGISCGTVTSDLTQCAGYLMSGQGKPTPGCCGGVKSLAALANTTPARRAVCSCLKSAYSQFPNVNSAAVSGLPGSCGVNLPFKISLQTNCNTYLPLPPLLSF